MATPDLVEVGDFSAPPLKPVKVPVDKEWCARFPLRARGRDIVDQAGWRFKFAGVNW